MSPKRRQRQGPGFGEGGGTNVADYIGLSERQAVTAEDEVVLVPVNQIQRSPYQARVIIDPGELRALAENINEHGLHHPIALRRKPDGRYELLAGERRWRAAELVGMDHIEARIRELDDFDAHLVGVGENSHRADLSPWEKALETGELQTHAAAAGRPSRQRDLARYLNRNVSTVNQQLAIAYAVPREMISRDANLTAKDLSRLPHEALYRIAKLPFGQRLEAVKEAKSRQARNANQKEAPPDDSDPPSGETADRWTQLWKHGGLRVHVRKPLRALEPARARKYLEQLLPGVGGLAARAADKDENCALLQWEHEQGKLLLLKSPHELTGEERHAARDALMRMIADLDAAE